MYVYVHTLVHVLYGIVCIYVFVCLFSCVSEYLCDDAFMGVWVCVYM